MNGLINEKFEETVQANIRREYDKREKPNGYAASLSLTIFRCFSYVEMSTQKAFWKRPRNMASMHN
ncbi:MAG: hypothetical protein AB1480_12665 [Nitrospirota bacterium]